MVIEQSPDNDALLKYESIAKFIRIAKKQTNLDAVIDCRDELFVGSYGSAGNENRHKLLNLFARTKGREVQLSTKLLGLIEDKVYLNIKNILNLADTPENPYDEKFVSVVQRLFI